MQPARLPRSGIYGPEAPLKTSHDEFGQIGDAQILPIVLHGPEKGILIGVHPLELGSAEELLFFLDN
jgi:hypothetical protein